MRFSTTTPKTRPSLTATIAVAVSIEAFLVIGKALWLASSLGVGRPRRFAPGWFARLAAEVLPLPVWLRAWVSSWTENPSDLSWPPAVAMFAAETLLAGMAFGLVLAAGTRVALLLAARRRSLLRGPRASYVAVLATLTALPAFEFTASIYWALVMGAVGKGWPSATATLVSLGTTVPLWGLFFFVSGSVVARMSATLRRSCTGVVFAAALVAICLMAAPVLEQRGRRGGAPASTDDEAPLGVLLISIDTLRADHLGCYGYERETSPTLDGIAAEGVRFRDMVAASSWTLPTHLSMLTSLPPVAHGVTRAERGRLNSNIVTLAEVFRDAGYQTAAFVVSGYMDAGYGHIQGFEHYDDYSAVVACKTIYSRCVTSPDLIPQIQKFFTRWDADGRQRPFFTLVHLMDVHNDYKPPPPFDTMFDDDYRGSVSGTDPRSLFAMEEPVKARDLEHIVSLYDGEVRFVDSWIKRLFDTMRNLGILDRTVVAITADHGEEFLEHGGWNHNRTLYDEVLRVPLLLRYPARLPAGLVVEETAQHIDLAPTLLALAGVDPSIGFGRVEPASQYPARDLNGAILRALEKGEEADAEVFASLADTSPVDTSFADLYGTMVSVRSGRFKLIRSLDGSVDDQLYDLNTDPGEQHNVTESYGDGIRKMLAAKIDRWREHWKSLGSDAETMKLSSEQRERLRALGYLD